MRLVLGLRSADYKSYQGVHLPVVDSAAVVQVQVKPGVGWDWQEQLECYAEEVVQRTPVVPLHAGKGERGELQAGGLAQESSGPGEPLLHL